MTDKEKLENEQLSLRNQNLLILVEFNKTIHGVQFNANNLRLVEIERELKAIPETPQN